MQNQAYLDIIEDDQQDARAQERQAIGTSIEQMLASDGSPDDKLRRIETIHYVTRVWSYLLNDLASEENQGTQEFRATMISIGVFIMKHMDNMRQNPVLEFKPVREISEIIHTGLK